MIELNASVLIDIDVGMTWDEAHRRCPEGIIPACHNSLDTVTVSGPADSVKSFVAELQKEGVFAKAIHSSGVAFHCPYMSQAAPALKQRLQQVCPVPTFVNPCKVTGGGVNYPPGRSFISSPGSILVYVNDFVTLPR